MDTTTPPPVDSSNPITPPQITAPQSPSSPDTQALMRFESEKKSAGVALFLCWVVGIFGGHRFYLGRPHAVTMLIITLLSFPLCLVMVGFLGLLATWVWMIVDLFQVSKWAKEYNTALLLKIQASQG